MKKIIMTLAAVLFLTGIGFAANEDAKRDGNRFPTELGISAVTGEIRNIKVDDSGNLIISATGSSVAISTSQVSLLQRTTTHLDAPVSVLEAPLLARPTAHIDGPVSVTDMPVIVSTWTSYAVTGVTSSSLVIPISLIAFDVLADGGGGKLNSNFGAGMVLADGVGRGSPIFGNSITSPVINLSDLSISATYYIDVYGK